MTYRAFDDVFERFRYPAGETHLRLRAGTDATVIEARVTSFDGLGEVLTADRLLRRIGQRVTWFLPYFPFARHDRRNDRFDGLELEVALDLVRDLDVVIADPHSDVAGMLPHIPQHQVVEVLRLHGMFDHEPIIVIPDAGATKKAHEWVGTAETVQASKRRDPATGQLSGFEVHTDDLDGRPCIIVDDICDGGGTFLGLASELRAKNAGPLTLAVTHGLFTKGIEALAAKFNRIVTFTYAGQPAPAGVTGIPFEVLYEKGAQQ